MPFNDSSFDPTRFKRLFRLKDLVMRELKFRALYKNERFDFVELVSYKDGSLGVSVGRSGFSDLTCAPDETIVEQFTGLKDEDGFDVYEGDELLFNGYISTVVYNVGNARFEAHGEKHTVPAHKFKLCKIIGNIHENKDLI